jgi:hypothetical protein
MTPQRRISTIPLKNWGQHHLASAPNLRFLILTEKDEITCEEFLIKIEIWARLLDQEITQQTRRN